MADVYVGRFNRAFEKLFNIKGGPAVVDVEGSIRGSVPFPFGVEERYLLGVETFAAADSQAAVAANKSAFMIRNPINSGIIVALEKILISPGAAGGVLVSVAGSNPADLATAVASHSRADPRGRSTGTAIVSRDAPAADPGTGFLPIVNVTLTAVTDLITTPNHEIILLPQIALRVIQQTLNTALSVTFFWRERPLETSELT